MLKYSQMKLVEINPQDFNNLAITEPNTSFYQTSNWGNFNINLGYSPIYLGYVDDANMYYALTMILIKKGSSFISKKQALCPGGFLINFYDIELVKQFTLDIKKYISKKGVSELIISPNLTYLTKKGNNDLLIQNLKQIGYEKTKNCSRYTTYISTIPSSKNTEDIYLKSYVVEDNFDRLFKINSNYKNIFQNMGDYAKFIVCELDLNKSITSLNKGITDAKEFIEMHQYEFKYKKKVEKKKLAITQKQDLLALLDKLAKGRDENPILAVTCMIEYNKKVTLLFLDDKKEYRVLNTLKILNERVLKTISQSGYECFDTLKEYNNSTITELIGEFTLRV